MSTQDAPSTPTCTPQWDVLCDWLADCGRYEPQRIAWLRDHEDPVTVGMVGRAEPELRPLVERWWQEGPPEDRRQIGPIRFLLLEAGTPRETVWARLPEGFEALEGDTRARAHLALGWVILAYRGTHGEAQWPRWNLHYQQRWGIGVADYELASQSHRIGARFAEGGLEGLLRDVAEAAQAEAEREREANAFARDAVERLRQGARPWRQEYQQEPQPAWQTAAFWEQLCARLSTALGGPPVRFARRGTRAATLLSWDGAVVEVEDEAAAAWGQVTDGVVRGLVQHLRDVRRTMPDPPMW